MFVSFKEFPWFREASIDQITKVELPSPHHLYWPDLDADVAVESLEHPERYPLVSRARPTNPRKDLAKKPVVLADGLWPMVARPQGVWGKTG